MCQRMIFKGEQYLFVKNQKSCFHHYLYTNKTKNKHQKTTTKNKTHLACFLACLKSMTVSQPFEMREALLTSYL